ncbi:major facilitator superfamily domain-containing protein [Hyaloraphidium curvatum]|nr:major facilitator superfamily domain-containing protein [Hyaloraphidium curvatum]
MAALQAFHFLLGLFTVLPQIVVPTVADLSNRMSVDVGLTVGCTQVGVLYGRVVSGLVADALGWRTSFGVAVATQVAVLALLILFFPEIPPAEEGSVVRYPRLILSSLKLAGTRAVLQQSAAIAFFCFLSMASYWTTSVYLMGSPAYGLPVSTIGLLGLAGMGGILAAPLAGILPFPPHKLVALGITAQFLAWTVALASGTRHLAALFACAFLTDLGRQLQQVGNQLRVFSALPGHKSRANAVYMVLAYLGTFAGTALGTLAYERAAWLGAGAVGMAALACAALAWAWVSPDGRFLWDRFRGEKRGGASEEEAVALMSDVGDGERAGLFAVGLLEELDQFGDFEGAGSLAVGVAGRMEDIEGTV